MKRPICLLAFLFFSTAAAQNPHLQFPPKDAPALPAYTCYRTPVPVEIDGDIYKPAWENAPWSEDFVDISGDPARQPALRTRMKMLWDDEFIYIAAELEEPHLWSELTERESALYNDNNFEVFIDPDGDTHNYFEIEINTLGTEWDLMMLQPYRDSPRGQGSPAIQSWTLREMKSTVRLYGTVNDPTDTDEKWTVELALPIAELLEFNSKRHLEAGDRWKMNFGRMEWLLEPDGKGYRKKTEVADGKATPVKTGVWSWSPIAAPSMHVPDRWGTVLFSQIIAGEGRETLVPHPDDNTLAVLRELYYRQKEHMAAYGQPARDLAALNTDACVIRSFSPELWVSPSGYWEIRTESNDKTRWIYIRSDGKTWKQPK